MVCGLWFRCLLLESARVWGVWRTSSVWLWCCCVRRVPTLSVKWLLSSRNLRRPCALSTRLKSLLKLLSRSNTQNPLTLLARRVLSLGFRVYSLRLFTSLCPSAPLLCIVSLGFCLYVRQGVGFRDLGFRLLMCVFRCLSVCEFCCCGYLLALGLPCGPSF